MRSYTPEPLDMQFGASMQGSKERRVLVPDNKGLEIYGWCIMTSHVHMIIGTNKDKLENIMRDMKS